MLSDAPAPVALWTCAGGWLSSLYLLMGNMLGPQS